MFLQLLVLQLFLYLKDLIKNKPHYLYILMKKFGLIGYPLTHSFSKKYFSNKFDKEGISNCKYELFPLERIEDLSLLLKQEPNLIGLNVTLPYKEQVLPYLNEIDDSAATIGAVNTIKIKNNQLAGFNTDTFGFEESLNRFIAENDLSGIENALILGSGGASKAVKYVLDRLNISYKLVSRNVKKGDFCYNDLNKSVLSSTQLIINTTPLGTFPNTDSFPDIPYEYLNSSHLLFDLVYNPEKTVFLKKGASRGAYIKNGLEMLVGQAEQSWKIWMKEEDS